MKNLLKKFKPFIIKIFAKECSISYDMTPLAKYYDSCIKGDLFLESDDVITEENEIYIEDLIDD